jgi:hypothetical protein
MSQLQAQVPHPLRHQLPALLTPDRVRAPAVGVDFLILIRERGLKGAAMQIQLDDIGSGEGLLRQVGEEEFVNDACTCDTNRTFLFAGWMGGHHHAAGRVLGSHWDLRAVVDAAYHLTLLSEALTDLVGDGDVPGQADDRARCTLCRGLQRRTQPDRRARLPSHIVHQAAARHAPGEGGAPWGTDLIQPAKSRGQLFSLR